MPSFIPCDTQDRATITLHAPWWSAEKDVLGRWKERVVVRVPIMQEDIDAALATLNIEKVTQHGNFFGLLAAFRQALYAQIFVEVTDARGVSQPLRPETIAFPVRDTIFINTQLEVYLRDIAPTNF